MKEVTERLKEFPAYYWLSSAEGPELGDTLSRSGWAVQVLRGSNIDTTEDLFSEMAVAWSFPAYYGRNWSATADLLSDLSWLPDVSNIAIIVTDTHRLCSGNLGIDFMYKFALTLESAQEDWLSGQLEVGRSFAIIFTGAEESDRQMLSTSFERLAEAEF